WIQVAVRANVPANSSVYYSLRSYPGVQAAGSARDVTIITQGSGYLVNTGVARFTIAPTSSRLITSALINGRSALNDNVSDGPYIVDAASVRRTATVDSLSFRIEERGPVKVVVRSAGHFAPSDNGNASCTRPLAYTARMIFVAGSPNVTLEYDVRNECGGGQQPDSGDFWSRFAVVQEAGWRFSLNSNAAETRNYIVSESLVSPSAVAFSGASVIQQEYGSTSNPNWRRASSLHGATTLATPEFFTKPMVAIGDSSLSAAILMPWMRYREPQALQGQNGALSLRFISSRSTISEAQTRWNFAQLRFFEASPSDRRLGEERDRGILELERALLPKPQVYYVNATGVMPRLPERARGQRLGLYSESINRVHNDTIRPGGQWDRGKKYGSAWPDSLSNDQYGWERDSAELAVTGSNYWSPTSSEFAEYFRTGDPRFVWDYALPAEQTFLKSIVYSTGTNPGPVNVMNGLIAGNLFNTNQRTGQAFRSGGASSDYLYTQGSDEAYLIRPTRSLLEVYEQACRTIIRRYDSSIPEANREEFVSRLVVQRQVIQQMNLLKYAVEFIQDQTTNQLCADKLRSVIDEYVRDNMLGGMLCVNDIRRPDACSTDQNFMYSALHFDFFESYLRHFGDRNGVIRGMLGGMANQFYQVMIPKRPDGSIDVNGVWAKILDCTIGADGRLQSCARNMGSEPSYSEERPMHLSVLLIADAVAQTNNLCSASARGLSEALVGQLYGGYVATNSPGWWKGVSMSMRHVVFGIGAAEVCDDDTNRSGGGEGSGGGDTEPPAGGGGTGGGGTPPGGPTNITYASEQLASNGTLPVSTFNFSSDQFNLQPTDAQYNFCSILSVGTPCASILLRNYLGNTNTCFGQDFIRYDFYVAAQNSTQYTYIGGHQGADRTGFSNGSRVDTGGCAKLEKMYGIRLPAAGAHKLAACVTNLENPTQVSCQLLEVSP
ncbi:MAG: hypothetical protein AB1540_17350, partial [Bdellovibrionota bacterium]